MATVTVSFDGSRLNDSDSNTNWGNFVIGGGAPASEYPLAYQVTSGTTSGAVNKKITSSAARQGVDYNHGTGQDMTAAATKLWFAKCYISDSFDLNTTWGVELAIGSGDTTNDHRYNVAGSGSNLSVYNQYPAQGGYLITSIDPEITAWREAVNGTPNWASVVWFAVGARGGPRIITAVLQVILNIVDFGMNLQEALDAPRYHHQLLPDELWWEKHGLNDDSRRRLEERGHFFRDDPRVLGVTSAVMVDSETGLRYGACDSRGGGYPAGY